MFPEIADSVKISLIYFINAHRLGMVSIALLNITIAYPNLRWF